MIKKDYSYLSQVNRRLTSARFFLSTYEEAKKASLSPIEKQAYIDSVLLQLYFGCLSYCNELLSHRQKQDTATDIVELAAVFDGGSYADVPDFNELRKLYKQRDTGLFQLCKFYKGLGIIGSKEEQERNRQHQDVTPINTSMSSDSSSSVSAIQNSADSDFPVKQTSTIVTLIASDITVSATSADEPEIDLSDVGAIKNLLAIIQELIDRQREYLVEY